MTLASIGVTTHRQLTIVPAGRGIETEPLAGGTINPGQFESTAQLLTKEQLSPGRCVTPITTIVAQLAWSQQLPYPPIARHTSVQVDTLCRFVEDRFRQQAISHKARKLRNLTAWITHAKPQN